MRRDFPRKGQESEPLRLRVLRSHAFPWFSPDILVQPHTPRLAAGTGGEETRVRAAHPTSHVPTCTLRMYLLVIRSEPPPSQGAPHQENRNMPWGRGGTEIDSWV